MGSQVETSEAAAGQENCSLSAYNCPNLLTE